MEHNPNDKKKIHLNDKTSIIILVIISLISSLCFISEINFGSAQEDTSNDYSNLFINELMADNDITIPGPDMNYPDWIELYNAGTDSLNISGLYLTDDFINPTKWQFPNNTIIDSGEYLLIWCDGYNSSEEVLYASFRLNANGDTVALFANDGLTLIDSVTFRKQIRDTSYGRLPDASEDWEYLLDPSPGWANGESSSDEKTPSWILPMLIVLLIIVLVAAIVIRKILIRRGFK